MMKRSIYTNLGIVVKRLTGIKDISLWRKNMKKRIGKIIYHKKYTAKDLVALMQTMGMKEGSVVCIHSSMKEFYNFQGTAEELITEILKALGPEGTLVMPAYPRYEYFDDPNYIFNPLTDETGAGYLAETFRKYPGVKRSINVQHSVCAIGKYADWLLKDHHHCLHDCVDKDSPWYRLIELDALVFNFGMPRSYMGTFHHCVESQLHDKYPYWSQFYNYREKCRYVLDGEIHEYYSWVGKSDRRMRESRVTKYFTSDDWMIRRISNLEVKVFYTKNAFAKMLSFARRGITIYYVPSTKGFKFDD